MVSVVLALVVTLGLALLVLALVALPARRQGREVLSARGEHVVESLREHTERGRSTHKDIENVPEPVATPDRVAKPLRDGAGPRGEALTAPG